MRMLKCLVGLAATHLTAACWCLGQTSSNPVTGIQVLISVPVTGSASSAASGEVIRKIDDPQSGECWLLLRNPEHSAGPGRLVLTDDGHSALRSRQRPTPPSEAAVAVIRSGDRVVLEEHTAVADARLEAVAMGPALAGTAFNARLTISGRVVRAVAAGPGRATLKEEVR